MKLEIGDSLKIVRYHERFWVSVQEITDKGIVVKVDSYVRMQPPWQTRGELMNIQIEDIVAIVINDHQIGR